MSCFSWLLLKSRLAYLANSQLGQKPLFRDMYLSSVLAVGFADISASCFEQIDRSRISTSLGKGCLEPTKEAYFLDLDLGYGQIGEFMDRNENVR